MGCSYYPFPHRSNHFKIYNDMKFKNIELTRTKE